MSQLSDEWVMEEDGIRHRRGARVILLDGEGNLLLQRGHDLDNPSRHWWFTLGGGIGPNESDEQAAVREVFEESGIVVDPASLIGPVATRSAIFDFLAETVHQDEVFFVAVVERQKLDRSGWTPVEQEFLDEQRWVPVAEVSALEDTLYPTDLPELLAAVVDGWDGTVMVLEEQDDSSRR